MHQFCSARSSRAGCASLARIGATASQLADPQLGDANGARARSRSRRPAQRLQRLRRHAQPRAEKHGESDARIFALAAWREAPYYTDAERAALALAEAETRLCDRSDPVPDALWKEASAHFSEAALGALVTATAVANLWNRLNVTTRQPTGDWIAQYI